MKIADSGPKKVCKKKLGKTNASTRPDKTKEIQEKQSNQKTLPLMPFQVFCLKRKRLFRISKCFIILATVRPLASWRIAIATARIEQFQYFQILKVSLRCNDNLFDYAIAVASLRRTRNTKPETRNDEASSASAISLK